MLEFLLQNNMVPLKGLLIKSPHSSFENKPPTNILHVLGPYKNVKKKENNKNKNSNWSSTSLKIQPSQFKFELPFVIYLYRPVAQHMGDNSGGPTPLCNVNSTV